jgi:dihydrofolate reductase
VFSRTLPPEQHPGVTVVNDDAGPRVAALRAQRGRQIWLFGGAGLFRSLLEAQQVDVIEVLVVPVLLGSGTPLLEPGARMTRLVLEDVERYPSGLLSLRYRAPNAAAVQPADAADERGPAGAPLHLGTARGD